MSASDLAIEMLAYIRACRRQGDRRDARTIVATSGLWRSRQVLAVMDALRG
jgi:hypothetical protein